MLRRVTLKNFVHFNEKQEINLPLNSPIIFVGASSSGKTAVLELIRRCLDGRINSSLTTRAKPDLTAYVFCTFTIDATNITDLIDYDTKVISGILVDGEQTVSEDDRDKDSIQEITENDGNSRDDDDDDEEKEDQKYDEPKKRYDEGCDQIFHKIIIYTYKNKIKIRSKTYIEKKDGKIVDFQQNVKLPESLFSLLKEGDHEAFVRKVLLYIRTNQEKENIYDEKPKMWNAITSTFVGVLSMRGMGTFQWTKSEKIAQDYKEDNYQNTCKHAEIITDLMRSTSKVIDDDKEKRIFKYLTDEERIVFKKTSDAGNTDSITIARGGKVFPLLKTSIGIIEAKQFSLLMAHKELKTICYEEPDRGMHPQMIQRMKEILHRESQESKTIIVVTHSPMLVDSMWLENTFIFCKEDEMYLIKSFDQALPDKNAKLSEIEEMKTLLFSSKVLLVEGKSDKVVLQGIFRHCFNKLASESNEGDRDEKIINYQILPCGGWSFTKPVKEFCDNIKVKCLLLLDRDTVIITDNRGCIECINEQGFSSANEEPISEFIHKTEDGFDSLSRKLEETGRFIWKEGDLEDVLLCDKAMRGDICLTLGINNYKSLKRMKLKEKIKTALSHGLTQEQSEKLTKIIINFEDVQRLLNFLRES